MENPLIQHLLLKLHTLSCTKSIVFCWIPSHIGIKGNEDANISTKQAQSLQESKIKLPFTDFKPNLNTYILSKWQSTWNNASFNKLRDIKPTLGEWHQGNRSVRREEVFLSRCRIGHTHLTNSYLLKNDDQPQCIPCQAPLTVKHILIDCVDFAEQRRLFFNAQTLKDLFENVSVDNFFIIFKTYRYLFQTLNK